MCVGAVVVRSRASEVPGEYAGVWWSRQLMRAMPRMCWGGRGVAEAQPTLILRLLEFRRPTVVDLDLDVDFETAIHDELEDGGGETRETL